MSTLVFDGVKLAAVVRYGQKKMPKMTVNGTVVCFAAYGMFHGYMSYLQEVISEVILNEEYYIKLHTILNGYRAVGREI
jgi:hypothetical protein